MKKWSFLVAALLMMSATVTTTSCIDNDEPEGITVLRGAKAELLKAKAALELAKAETEKQNANLVAAQATVQQAIAKEHEAAAKINEAEAKKVEAEAALVNANTEIAKAQAQQELAKLDQLIAENAITLEKLQAEKEAALINAKKDAAEAQAALENTLAEIEAAKAVLTDKEATKLGSLENIAALKFNAYVEAQKTVLSKMEALFNAEDAKQTENEAYQEMLADAKAEAEALKAVLEDLNELKNSTEITEWETKLAELKDFVNVAEVEYVELGVQRAEIKEANRDLAHKIADELEPAVDGAKKALDKVSKEDKYEFSKAEIKVDNEEVQKLLKDAATALGLTVPSFPLKYDGGKETYENMAKDEFVPKANVAKWEKIVKKASQGAEDLATAECQLEADKKAVTEAEKNHKEAVENWTKMHQQKETGEKLVTVPTTDLEAAVDAYNTAYDALKKAVETYNDTYKTTYDGLVSAYEAEKYFDEYKPAYIGALSAYSSVLLPAEMNKAKYNSRAALEAYIDDNADSDKKIGGVDIATIKKTAHAAGQTAENAVYGTDAAKELLRDAAITDANGKIGTEKAVTDAKTAYENAETELGKKETALKTALTDAKKGYIPALNAAAQNPKNGNALDIDVLSGVMTLDKDNKIVDAVYPTATKEIGKEDAKVSDLTSVVVPAVKADKDGKKWEADTDYKKMLAVAAIDKAAVVAAAEGILDTEVGGLAENAWKTASDKAFGAPAGVHAEVPAAKCVGGTGKVLADAQAAVASDEAVIAAMDDIKALKESVATQKTTLETEIAAAKAVVDEAKDALKVANDDLKAAKDEWDALFTEVNEAEHALDWTLKLKDDIKKNLEAVIKVYYAGLDIDGVKDFASLQKFINNEIEAAEKDLKDAEKIMAMAQKDLDQMVSKEEFDGVAVATLELEAAQAKLATAQAQYEFALAQLNAYVEALSK